jgi:predicted  nucleic acid-binding Zn-ribbon protein
MHIEVRESGIKCDNPMCDFRQEIPFEDRIKWIGRPCPKCGENLLTRADFEKSQELYDFLADPKWERLEEEIRNAYPEQKMKQIAVSFLQQREDNGKDSLTIRINEAGEEENPPIIKRIDAVLGVIDKTLESIDRYADCTLRMCFIRDMTSIRDMVKEMRACAEVGA